MSELIFISQIAGPTLKSSDINAFEHRWSLSLPSDYSNFLLMANGGVPSTSLYRNGDAECYVAFYFYLDPSGTKGLDEELRKFNMSLRFVPVALEGGGGIIALDLEAKGVFLISAEDIRGFNANDHERLAESWTDFLSHLEAPQESAVPEEDIRQRIVRDSDCALLDDFLNAGGEIEGRSKSGETLVQIAVIRTNTGMLDALLQRGATLRGALHSAAAVGKVPMIDWLCEHGANLGEKDAEGRLPEEVARMPYIRRYIETKRKKSGNP